MTTERSTADALHPPCPTCGGKHWLNWTVDDKPLEVCPDCGDGKVPLERLVKVFEAVHGATLYDHLESGNQADRFVTGWLAAHDHLRAIR